VTDSATAATSRGLSASSIPEIIRRRTEIAPESVALASPSGPVSYRRLLGYCAEVDGLLRAVGIGRRDHVAIVLPNGLSLAAAFLAVGSRAVCAPLNPAYTRAELAFYLSDLQASALVTRPDVDSAARELAQELRLPVLEPELCDERDDDGGDAMELPDPEDIALVLHTSGTTARPKIVPLTHRNLCASARNVAFTLELTEEDRCLNVMPLFHIHGLVGVVLSSLWAGAEVICLPGMHAPSFLASLDEGAPTWYSAVPTMHQSVLAAASETEGRPKHALRFIRSSSAGLPPPVLDGLESMFGVPVIEAYGMTEAAHQMTSNRLPPSERRRGSVGQAAGPEITVLGPGGEELPRGQVGEVAIRGENVFGGYLGDVKATTAAFSEGWFRTGDEGRLDDAGYLFLHGRIKEIINRGGEKISPAEVEAVLLEHPDVVQATAFAIPHDLLGEDVGAAIVLSASGRVSESELQAFAGQRLADFKVPRVVAFVDEVPKGPTGKVQRIGLAARLGVTPRTEGDRPDYTPPRSPLEHALAEMIGDVLDVERVGGADDFFALGGDSLLAAELVARIRSAFDRPHFPLSTLVWAPTIEKLALELDRPSVESARPLIVPLQAEGDRTPLFFVHAMDGEIVRYAGLARRLDRDHPFLAIRARGADGDEAAHGSLDAMVADYVDSVRQLQPQGPYILGGVCMGGTVAVEMATRLQRAGEEVALVILVDPRVQAPRSLAWLRVQAALTAHKVGTGDYSWKLAHAERRREVMSAVWRALGRPAPGTDSSRRAFEASMASIRAECVPSPYDGPVRLFATMDYPLREWFWAPLLADLAGIEELPHRHGSILRPPAVDDLADVIRAALAEFESH
jgi:acyl-CoA synthetase (AMP-forming)/AMP-acid ligase II/thioesterase domain-containing protein